MAGQFFELRNSRRNSRRSSPYAVATSNNPDITASPSARSFGPCHGRKLPMFTAKQYRAKAAESAESLKHTDVPSEIREFQRSMESFTELAQNEDWLANNYDKIVHSQDVPSQYEVVGTPSTARLSPRTRSIFFAASARPSSCSGTRSRRSCNVSFSIPPARWGTC